MINYSIVMRSVNSNLIDINKAKGRINAALAAGEQPVQEDLDLVATETQKAYAIAQYADIILPELLKFDLMLSNIPIFQCFIDFAEIVNIV